MTFDSLNTGIYPNNNISLSHSTSTGSTSSDDDERMIQDENLPPSNGQQAKQAGFDPIEHLFNNICSVTFGNPDVTSKSSRESTSSSSRDSNASDSDQEGNSQPRGVKRKRGSTFPGYHSDSEQPVDNNPKRRKSDTNTAPSTHKAQTKINYICSCLHQCKISDRESLIKDFDKVINAINNNSKVFKPHYTEEQCFEIFKKALQAYNQVNGLTIRFSEADVGSHTFKNSASTTIPDTDDLYKIAHSYDQLVKSHEVKKSINEGILESLKSQEFVAVESVILGASDMGLSVWLEKYEPHHNKTQEKLSQGQFPDVLIVAENQGSWGHNGTLAQPHSFLERANIKWNPSNYVTQTHYEENAFVNGRHLLQANKVALAKTEAPVVTASFTSVETKSQHSHDWKRKECEYRVIITTPHGIKTIYTHHVDICTGLGPSRKILDSIIPKAEFDRLSQFDENKQFTPLVSGNQFVLTGSEENCPNPRSIVVYGGGGTAAASYRKAFFGHDNGTQYLEFNEANGKNSVTWIAREYDTVGSGRLASRSIASAKSHNALLLGDLQKITQDPSTGKLKLLFKNTDPKIAEPKLIELECDQLVYSIGQDDAVLKGAIKEFKKDMRYQQDAYSGTPGGYETRDGNVHAFGAASLAVGIDGKYVDATREWLKKESIGNVGIGTMIPSRAQLKEHVAKKQSKAIKSVNINADSKRTMEKFLSGAGVRSYVANAFLDDVYATRKSVGIDFSHALLQKLLDKHNLNGFFNIVGHGTLVRK